MIFLWIFLPVTIIGYYVLPGRCRNVFLLLASILFYSWGEPVYVFLMLLSIFVNWLIGIGMEKYAGQKKLLLLLAIVVNLSLLGYFKYAGFFINIVNDVTGMSLKSVEIALPIGISFFTFQALSYVIDLYRGEYKAQKNVINLALYISFFPQLIAGPIVKYKDIDAQLTERTCSFTKMAEGIRRFIYGLGKKVIISNTLALSVDKIYALEYSELTGWLVWLSAICYSLQIYYDFSGYSDMAIGLGKMFGFTFQENFNYPYRAASIREFWQRWHISLSTWFKEYLYIPLGGNRKGKARTYLNLIVVFFATGLWHGASYNFVLWGLYHGFFSILERTGWKKWLERHTFLAHLYTLLVVNFGWVLFRSDSLQETGVFIRRMLFPWNYQGTGVTWQYYLSNKTILAVVLGVAGCGLFRGLAEKAGRKWNWGYSYLELLYCSATFVLCLSMLASNTYNPFIYFRF